MTDNRYDAMFEKADGENRGVFIPFLMTGDPDPETSLTAALTLIEAGADGLELGIPFSDPVADGPVIQAAALRALEHGATPSRSLEIIAAIRQRHPAIPIGILTYANAVFQTSLDDYFQTIRAAGVDSVLTADLPVFEAEDYAAAAARHGVCPVFIAPPNARPSDIEEIARFSKGYTYVVARAGVTGCDDRVSLSFEGILGGLRRAGAARPVVGFGISEPHHVAQVIAAGAAGAISGSKTVQLLQEAGIVPEQVSRVLSPFVRAMKRATVRNSVGGWTP